MGDFALAPAVRPGRGPLPRAAGTSVHSTRGLHIVFDIARELFTLLRGFDLRELHLREFHGSFGDGHPFGGFAGCAFGRRESFAGWAELLAVCAESFPGFSGAGGILVGVPVRGVFLGALGPAARFRPITGLFFSSLAVGFGAWRVSGAVRVLAAGSAAAGATGALLGRCLRRAGVLRTTGFGDGHPVPGAGGRFPAAQRGAADGGKAGRRRF